MLFLFWKALHLYYFCIITEGFVRMTSLTHTPDRLHSTFDIMNVVFSIGHGELLLWRTSSQNIKGEVVCFIYGAQVTLLKDYNLNRYFMTKQEDDCRCLSNETRTLWTLLHWYSWRRREPSGTCHSSDVLVYIHIYMYRTAMGHAGRWVVQTRWKNVWL